MSKRVVLEATRSRANLFGGPGRSAGGFDPAAPSAAPEDEEEELGLRSNTRSRLHSRWPHRRRCEAPSFDSDETYQPERQQQQHERQHEQQQQRWRLDAAAAQGSCVSKEEGLLHAPPGIKWTEGLAPTS